MIALVGQRIDYRISNPIIPVRVWARVPTFDITWFSSTFTIEGVETPFIAEMEIENDRQGKAS